MKKLFISFIFIMLSTELFANEYHLATYNICVNEKNWKNRIIYLSNLILYNNFDIFGTQEVSPSQFIDLNTYLKDIYSCFGVGREDGKKKGEYCAIFYKKDKFKFIDGETFWLSETPNKVSKGWDAAHNRICTWVKLKDINNQTEIYFFNTHIDHKGTKARTESCNLLLNKIKQICPIDANIILTGDLNFNQNSSYYKILSESSLLKDSYELAKYKWAPTGTFSNNNLNKKTISRIDHILVSKSVKVLRYGILNNFYFENDNKENSMQAISDHYPVSVFVEFQNTNKIENTDKSNKNNEIDSIKNKILNKIFK